MLCKLVCNLLRFAPFVVYWYYLVHGKNLFVTNMIGNDIFNIILKYAFYILWPKVSIFHRPKNTALLNTPGFPSGHSQHFMFLFIMHYRKNGFVWSWAILLVIVSYSRWYLQCHNMLQILGGFLGGLAYSSLLPLILN